MRVKVSYNGLDIGLFKEKLLWWAQAFESVVWLDSNKHYDRYGSFEALMAIGARSHIQHKESGAFEALSEYRRQTADWLVGYLSYDLKNDVEPLESHNPDGLGFPALCFFQPEKIIQINRNTVDFCYLADKSSEIRTDFEEIRTGSPEYTEGCGRREAVKIKMGIFKDEYFRHLHNIQAHIHRGDIYEANFCQEFYAEGVDLDPMGTYLRLNRLSEPPFAAYLRWNGNFLLCASPERFLKKTGNTIISQPIKGTTRRSEDSAQDVLWAHNLANDPKERAENVMIVDLVRNDLSKYAIKGSVTVPELFGIRPYKQVHQMVSTVRAQLSNGVDPIAVIKAAFPMGSMTGAPKVSAMKIIEREESFKRGLYSGAVGYFMPNGDFDLNVVIRSIQYNAFRKYVSFAVGSAITAKSVPEREYEECLLKAKAMRQVLEE